MGAVRVMPNVGIDETTRLRLTGMLRRFIDGEDRSIEWAGSTGVAFDHVFGEDEPYGSFVLALASYRLGGGAYLYGEQEILARCNRILAALRPEVKE